MFSALNFKDDGLESENCPPSISVIELLVIIGLNITCFQRKTSIIHIIFSHLLEPIFQVNLYCMDTKDRRTLQITFFSTKPFEVLVDLRLVLIYL